MRALLFLFLVNLFGTHAAAQQKCAAAFNSYNSIGFIAGKLPVTFTAQTENGVKYKNWFLGAGFGLDNYFIKTLPLFVSVKREFLFKKNSLILFANAGGQFVTKDKKIRTAFAETATQPGLYYDAGLGYKIKTTKRGSIYFTLGNSYKNIQKKETSLDTGFPSYSVAEFKLNRISLRAGYQF